jgi:hypothetical protein
MCPISWSYIRDCFGWLGTWAKSWTHGWIYGTSTYAAITLNLETRKSIIAEWMFVVDEYTLLPAQILCYSFLGIFLILGLYKVGQNLFDKAKSPKGGYSKQYKKYKQKYLSLKKINYLLE